MYQQSRILERVSDAMGEARVRFLMAAESFANRTALGRRVCEEFGSYDALGRPQQAGCMKALRTLDELGACRISPGGCRHGHGSALPQPAAGPSFVVSWPVLPW